MKPELFKEPAPGKCIKTLENYWAYVPNPLPPKLVYDEELLHLLSEGDRLVGELKGMGNMLPNPYLLITPYAQREAVSSSQIEGTRASLSDLTLLLLERRTLSQPILYLSGFFHKYRSEYYNRLFEVSQKGAWNEWVKFFLRGVSFQSQTAIRDAKKLSSLHEELVELVRSGKKMPETAILIVEELFQNPMLSIAKLSKDWGLPYNSVKNGVERLVRMGLLEEKTGGMRNRIYVCPKLLRIVTQAGD